MKERELSPSDKSRKTKLSKKSVEELVGIILRKDDTERKLNRTIDTFKKLQVTSEKRIETLQDSLNKSEEIQTNQEKIIAALNDTLDIKYKRISILEDDNQAFSSRIKMLDKTINSRNKSLRVSFMLIIVLLVILISLIVL
nr:MAG TPA: hypothetical protein [Crassvirales sp.]